jgi:hypothetical protein
VDRFHLVPWTPGILIGLKEVYHVEDAGTDERILLKLDSKSAGCKLWTEFMWFKSGTTGLLL